MLLFDRICSLKKSNVTALAFADAQAEGTAIVSEIDERSKSERERQNLFHRSWSAEEILL